MSIPRYVALAIFAIDVPAAMSAAFMLGDAGSVGYRLNGDLLGPSSVADRLVDDVMHYGLGSRNLVQSDSGTVRLIDVLLIGDDLQDNVFGTFATPALISWVIEFGIGVIRGVRIHVIGISIDRIVDPIVPMMDSSYRVCGLSDRDCVTFICMTHVSTEHGNTMFGKHIRMERIIDRKSGNAVVVPMDHGISVGPINGLTDMKGTINNVVEGGATAVLMHKGIIARGHRAGGKDVGLILHMSASTDIGVTSNSKVLVATVEEGLKYGADAVSVHINVGAQSETQMLSDIGKVSESCMEWGMPLLIMAYPRGPSITDSFDPKAVAHAARVATELGADVVKCSFTGDFDSFSRVVEGALAPVLIAGGPKMDSDMEILEMVETSIAAGGHGVSMGRNVFQHSDVRKMMGAISDIVLHGFTAKEAFQRFTE